MRRVGPWLLVLAGAAILIDGMIRKDDTSMIAGVGLMALGVFGSRLRTFSAGPVTAELEAVAREEVVARVKESAMRELDPDEAEDAIAAARELMRETRILVASSGQGPSSPNTEEARAQVAEVLAEGILRAAENPPADPGAGREPEEGFAVD